MTLADDIKKVKPGDRVTATFRHDGHAATVDGEVWSPSGRSLYLANLPLRFSDGMLASLLVSIDEHIPAIPPEPDEEDVLWLDRHKGIWRRHRGRPGRWICPATGVARGSWVEMVEEFGPGTVYRPEGD